MKAIKSLLAAALLGTGSAASAQAVNQTTAANVHVYMVGKQDPQHIVISEVMEVPATTTYAELLTRVRTTHPGVNIPDNTEGVQSTSASAAHKSREELKAKYEKAGKSVTVLEAR